MEVTKAAGPPSERAPGEGFLVLWAGASDVREREIVAALRRHDVRVEEVAFDGLVERANRRAPDLVALASTAARAPDAFVEELGRTTPGTHVPVITIGPSSEASPKARARFGLVARLDRDEETEELAKRIATLLRGLSRRSPRWRVRAGLGELPSIARRTAAARRTGLLSAKDAGGIAIDGDGRVAPEPGLFVASLTGMIEPELALHERASGTVRVLREVPDTPHEASALDGARVLVVDDDVERGRAFAADLEAAGARARATGVVSQAIHSGRALDPSVVIVAAPALVERAVATLWEDPRLTTTPLLVLDGAALEAGANALLGEVARICEGERSLRLRLERGEAVADRLETLGPTRWLKLLGGCEHEVTLRVFAATGRGRVDLSGGKIQGASFRPADPRAASVEGRSAVETLLGMRFGRVLAGPPGDLGKLEGMHRPRRQSIVGRIVPTAPSGVDGRAGLIAEEVVVRQEDLTPAVKVPRLTDAVGRKEKHASFADLDYDEDETTRTYSAEAVADLQAELRRSARADDDADGGAPWLDDELSSEPQRTVERGPRSAPSREGVKPVPAMKRVAEVSEDETADAEGAAREAATPPTLDAGGDEPEALLAGDAGRDERAASATDDGDGIELEGAAAAGDARDEAAAAATGPERIEKKSVAGEPAEASTGRGAGRPARDRDPVPDESENDEAAARRSAPSRAARAGTDDAAGAVTPETRAGSAPQDPRSEGSSWWFVAAVVLAIAVGGYAAWHLGDDPQGGPIATVDSSGRAPGGAASRSIGEPAPSDGVPASPDVQHATEGVDDPGPAGGVREPTAEGAEASIEEPVAVPGAEGPASAGALGAEDDEAPSGAAVAVEDDWQVPAGAPVAATSEGAADVPSATATTAAGSEARGGVAASQPAAEPAAVSADVSDLVEQSAEAARAGDYPRSEALARQALAAAPRHSRAAYRLAVALFRQRQAEDAMAWAQRASEWDPTDPLPISLEGDLHMRAGRFHHAARAFRRAVEVEPRFGPAQRRLDDLRERGVIQD